MNPSTIYLGIAVLALILILVAVFFLKKKHPKKISNLLFLAMMMVVASSLFEDRWISYGLIGVAMILIVVDLVIQKRINNQ